MAGARGRSAATVCLVLGAVAATGARAQTGCLGYPLDACLGSLRSSLAVDESFIAGSLARRHRVDVNGRTIGSGLVSISAKLPGRLEPLLILVHLAPDDRVTAIETALLRDPMPARTETEYDETGLYQLTLRLLGRRCPEMTPLGVFRFFENSVKPAVQRTQEDIRGGILGGHRRTDWSKPLPFCGAWFSYGGQVQWSGPLDLNFGRNITTVYTIKLE